MTARRPNARAHADMALALLKARAVFRVFAETAFTPTQARLATEQYDEADKVLRQHAPDLLEAWDLAASKTRPAR